MKNFLIFILLITSFFTYSQNDIDIKETLEKLGKRHYGCINYNHPDLVSFVKELSWEVISVSPDEKIYKIGDIINFNESNGGFTFYYYDGKTTYGNKTVGIYDVPYLLENEKTTAIVYDVRYIYKRTTSNGRFEFRQSGRGLNKNFRVKLVNYISGKHKDVNSRINFYTNNRMNEWREQGEFEKNIDYLNRIQETKKWIKLFNQEALNCIASKIDYEAFYLDKYDPENEMFAINSGGAIEKILLKVPINDAKDFKENFSYWRTYNFGGENKTFRENLRFSDERFYLSEMDIEVNKKIYKYVNYSSVDRIPKTNN